VTANEPQPEKPRFPFDPDEPLRRVPELELELRSDGSIHFPRHGFHYGPHALRVLDAFATPQSFREAMAALTAQTRGVQDWADLSSTIRGLVGVGILERVRGSVTSPSADVGYDAPIQHIAMLNDRQRTAAYLEAIPEVVREGDVVVEIGTGSGILALAAARAGARHVYAIETGAIGRAAEAMFAANGFSDRITLIPGLSTRVSLPERADVFVSELVGNEALEERILELTLDTIQRFLKPDARFVPRWLRVYAAAVEIPAPVVAGHRFTEETGARWSDWYGGFDFSPLGRANPPSTRRILFRAQAPRDWIRASEPVLLADIDLASGHPALLEVEVHAAVEARAAVNGLVSWFDLGLSPGVEISTDPRRAPEDNHWLVPVWMLPEPVPVEPGETLTLRYSYPGPIHRRVTISK
jgi:protein arginine N-methyltransferase 1